MGDDNRFQNARTYFEQSDNLINYFNENVTPLTNITLRYSTPSLYIDALNSEKIKWP
jgi:hypothetical protein